VIELGGELLTQTEDIVGLWKEHFKDLLDLANMSSIEKTSKKSFRLVKSFLVL